MKHRPGQPQPSTFRGAARRAAAELERNARMLGVGATPLHRATPAELDRQWAIIAQEQHAQRQRMRAH